MTSSAPSPLYLNRLPYVPLLRVLRYLDEFSLLKVRQTGQWLNQLVERNRRGLVFRVVGWVRISRKSYKRTFDISVRNMFRDQKSYDKEDFLENSPYSSSVFLWLAKKFPYVYIGILELESICFEEEEMDGLEQLIANSELRAQHIDIDDAIIGPDPNNALRIMTALRPVKLSIVQYRRLDQFALLLTEPFFTLMSSLMDVSIRADGKTDSRTSSFIEYPAHKIPEYFLMHGVFFMSLATIRTAIRNWCKSEHGIHAWWNISLPLSVCSNVRQLADTIGLSYVSNPEYPDLVKINSRNRDVSLCVSIDEVRKEKRKSGIIHIEITSSYRSCEYVS